jgi:integrase
MGRINRLNDLKARRAEPGNHADGGGLYLQVVRAADGHVSRSWIFRYATTAAERAVDPALPKERYMGLGAAHDVALTEARAKARDARLLRAQGVDPIRARDAARAAAALAGMRGKTFGECAEGWRAARADGWHSAKHCRNQKSMLEAHALPVLGALPVAAVDTALVLRVLEPIWANKTVTARRVRDNLESILDWAKVLGYRDGENPARWRGHLDHLLAKPSKVNAVKHHAALPYSEVGAFMEALRAREGRDAWALELIVLTAARVSEVTGMRWEEIDLSAGAWTIPASRMKSGREHRVPLSNAALAVLARVGRREGLLFPSARDKSLEKLRHRLGYGHITTHGFRSTFRDWAAECTNFPREIAEVALAHVTGGETERAYQRGDMFEKRRKLMDAWARFCAKPVAAGGAVVQLRAGA